MRSPLWTAVPALVALLAAVARWVVQGSGNVYTALDKRVYVPDPDLGWRVAAHGPVWLGLEAIAVIAGVAVGVALAALLLRRWERRRGGPLRPARLVLALVATAPLALPVWAFATGLGPARGRETLPVGATAAAPAAGDGIEGRLPLPAGHYQVVAHAGTAITAALDAGGESFEARFARGIVGGWTGDPADLTRSQTVLVSVDVAGVDTGIALRSEHARDEYLRAASYPTITLRIARVVAARQDGPAQVAFRAAAELDFLGDTLPVEVTGTLRAADAAARSRLGLAGDAAVVLVDAALDLSVKATKLRSDADSFDRDRIPIRVSLVLLANPPT